MSCLQTQPLLHPYLDGELDLVRSLEVEAHLEECPDCARLHRDYLALRAALASPGLYFSPPPALARSIHTALRPAPRWPLRLAIAASVVLAVLSAWGLLRYFAAPRPDRQAVAEQVLSAHVRSLMPNHLTDVLSSDQHTVKPWFAGRLDFSPPVKDLAADGFPLLGARLDAVGGRPVAAIVYGRRKHLINVFVWPAAPPEEGNGNTVTRRGYNLLHRTRSSMSYWIVSDLNRADLEQFARLLIPAQ